MNALQRRQQIGRIHAARSALKWSDRDYREMLDGLTGLTSCSDMTDGQINHVLDWLSFFTGRRARQPLSFRRDGLSPVEGLSRLLYAVSGIVPPGYKSSPLQSESWLIRMTGRAVGFHEYDQAELSKLVEGIKAVFRRAGQRSSETLDDLPLGPERLFKAFARKVPGEASPGTAGPPNNGGKMGATPVAGENSGPLLEAI
jgi:hypothetical protein